MRVIARRTLIAFAREHPETEQALVRWHAVVAAAEWSTMADVTGTFAKAKTINAERVRFEIAGGNYRLIAALDFRRQIAFVKFLGTHAQYDTVDAATVSLF